MYYQYSAFTMRNQNTDLLECIIITMQVSHNYNIHSH